MRAAHREIAGMRARQRGNFLLRGQKKVTKEEALNRTREPHGRDAACNSYLASAQMRTAALSRLTCHEHRTSPHLPVRRAAARRAHQNSPMQRRSGGAADHHSSCRRPSDAAVSGKPRVQPALRGAKWRWMVLVTGTAARAKRVASARNEAECFRAPLVASSGWGAVERLFFGDFLLAPQKKVTPPPGGTPGNASMCSSPRTANPGQADSLAPSGR